MFFEFGRTYRLRSVKRLRTAINLIIVMIWLLVFLNRILKYKRLGHIFFPGVDHFVIEIIIND